LWENIFSNTTLITCSYRFRKNPVSDSTFQGYIYQLILIFPTFVSLNSPFKASQRHNAHSCHMYNHISTYKMDNSIQWFPLISLTFCWDRTISRQGLPCYNY
jgi:hypothetical protein